MAEATTTPPDATPAARAVLAGARELFAERGYDGVSMRDVAARARVSKANVFHHFGSKAGLYDAVLADVRMSFDELLGPLAEDATPLPQRVERFAREHLALMLQDPSSVNLFLRQMLNAGGNPERERAEETLGHGLERFLQVLERDLPADSPQSRAPLSLALGLIGGTFMYFQLRGVLPRLDHAGTDWDPDAYAQALATLLQPGGDDAPDTPTDNPGGDA